MNEKSTQLQCPECNSLWEENPHDLPDDKRESIDCPDCSKNRHLGKFMRTYRLETLARRRELVEDVPRLVSELDLSDDVADRARDLLENAPVHEFPDEEALEFTAVAVYMASLLENEKAALKQVRDVADLSDMSMDTWKELFSELSEANQSTT